MWRKPMMKNNSEVQKVSWVIQMEGYLFDLWTPGKKNMESQHEGLEDDFLFQIYWFILLGGL